MYNQLDKLHVQNIGDIAQEYSHYIMWHGNFDPKRVMYEMIRQKKTINRSDVDNDIYHYSDNMISHQSTSNVISNPNDWSQSSMGRNHRKPSKDNNQQWWQWNDAIVLGERQWWYISIVWSLSKILPM